MPGHYLPKGWCFIGLIVSISVHQIISFLRHIWLTYIFSDTTNHFSFLTSNIRYRGVPCQLYDWKKKKKSNFVRSRSFLFERHFVSVFVYFIFLSPLAAELRRMRSALPNMRVSFGLSGLLQAKRRPLSRSSDHSSHDRINPSAQLDSHRATESFRNLIWSDRTTRWPTELIPNRSHSAHFLNENLT